MILKKRILDAVVSYKIFVARIMTAFMETGEDYYINGPDTLPPPLSPEKEAEAIMEMEADRSKSTVLIEHNLRLVVYIAKKFESTGVGLEDLISIGTIGLIKAINTFRSDKNIKLATYASRCIENEILMYIRKCASHKNDVSIDEPLNVDWDGNELLLSDVLGSEEDSVSRDMEKSEDEKAVREAVSELSERERYIIELRYGLSGKREYTQKEVADMMGISQSYISRLEKKIIGKLRERIKDKI
ncbi:MAG: RNA polymerase sporulation sigma factor SigE [Ruminococcaceae bacterium]|nr:RNA polymerase sporulation sigma factor SigE [Oscillospiraceae bacterium]